MQGGYPEIQIIFNRERIAAYGLQVPDIARTVVNKVKGELATRYSLRDRKIDVLVRAREKDRDSIKNIRELLVNPPDMAPLTLASVATVRQDLGPGEIHRVGQERVALIRANITGHDLGAAAKKIEKNHRHDPDSKRFQHCAGRSEQRDGRLFSIATVRPSAGHVFGLFGYGFTI